MPANHRASVLLLWSVLPVLVAVLCSPGASFAAPTGGAQLTGIRQTREFAARHPGFSGLVGLAFSSADTSRANSLNIADAGSSAAGGAPAAEVELASPAMLPAQVITGTLVRTIETSRWNPPSPDPSGITYLVSTGQLLISDGEVDEMPQYFAGANMFRMSLSGSLQQMPSTLSFSDEPTDVAFNPQNGHLFFSDDSAKRIFEVDPGADRLYGTGDDTRTSFNTQTFGSADPEGLAFGAGKLFVADGVGREIYIVAPGPNGIFDGVAPRGDDQITHFDTSGMNQLDPEGIEYNPDAGTLFIVSNTRRSDVVETTLSGQAIRVIELSFLAFRAPASVAYAPGGQNPFQKHLYIADRGVDNNTDPNENDGKIYEVAIGAGPPRFYGFLPLVRR